MPNTIIRDYRPEDREAVRRICFETGMMGGPIRDYYRDFDSFADMFTSYYTDAEPDSAMVVELDGKVVGYLLACLDARKVWSPITIGLKHSLVRGVCFRPGSAGFYWRSLWDISRDWTTPRRPRFDLARFPSHTHNSLLPEARGGGLAKECFFRMFDKLKLAGSTGMHGEGMNDNTQMIEFAEKVLGYQMIGKPYLCPGSRMPDGGRVWLRIMVRDLSEWVPGAWQKKRDKPRSAEVV
jgi:hypothetical protein